MAPAHWGSGGRGHATLRRTIEVEVSHPLPHLVVVSDIHLGLPQHASRSLHFAAWVDRLGARRLDDTPWRLILAGDIFEFLHLAPPGECPESARPPDLVGAVAKLCALRPILAPALAALGRFAASGNEVHFTIGNHDRELILRPVRRLLVRSILDAAGVGPRERRATARRIAIHPWFYSEPGQVHVEHGHQFDEFSSYTDVLFSHPVDEARPLEEPSSHLAVRLFIYRTQGLMRAEDGEQWGFFDFMRWGWNVGLRRALGFAGSYVSMLWKMTLAAVRTARHPIEPTAHALRSIHGHARQYGLELGRLLELRRTWHRPARAGEILRCYFVDRLLLVVFALAIAFSFWGGYGASVETAVAVPSAFVVVAGAWMMLERMRSTEQHPRLVRAAHLVRNALQVPFVVFGHSHVPARQRIEGGDGWYLNPGGWVDEHETEPGAIVLRRLPDGTLSLVSDMPLPPSARA